MPAPLDTETTVIKLAEIIRDYEVITTSKLKFKDGWKMAEQLLEKLNECGYAVVNKDALRKKAGHIVANQLGVKDEE